MKKPNVIVIGGSFAGLTAAFEIKRLLKDKVEVTVIARQEQFVFIPSFIWIVPGWRRPEQLTFDLKPSLESKGIRFINDRVDKIKAEENTIIVTANTDDFEYDYLVIATGILKSYRFFVYLRIHLTYHYAPSASWPLIIIILFKLTG